MLRSLTTLKEDWILGGLDIKFFDIELYNGLLLDLLNHHQVSFNRSELAGFWQTSADQLDTSL